VKTTLTVTFEFESDLSKKEATEAIRQELYDTFPGVIMVNDSAVLINSISATFKGEKL